MNIETFAGVVLARNIDVETPDAEISRLAHAKFADKAFCQLNIIPFDETTTADSIHIRIISKLLKDRVVYVMKYTDVDTLLGDDWSEIATAAGWSRDLPLDEWIGCTFEDKSLIELEPYSPTMSSLPESIGTFIRLQALTCIDWASLTALHVTLGNCVQLQKLDCSGCPFLTALPETLGNCVQLQALYCSDCTSLTALPETLGNCVQLQELHCEGCESLTALPETLGNCVQLQALYCVGCNSAVESQAEEIIVWYDIIT
jgi:Leucine-rich repeat (LRR) protein